MVEMTIFMFHKLMVSMMHDSTWSFAWFLDMGLAPKIKAKVFFHASTCSSYDQVPYNRKLSCLVAQELLYLCFHCDFSSLIVLSCTRSHCHIDQLIAVTQSASSRYARFV